MCLYDIFAVEQKTNAMEKKVKYFPTKVFNDYGITKAEVARRLNLSPITVSTFINGNPHISNVQRLADAIGADIMEFFTPLSKKDERVAKLLHILKETKKAQC